MKDHRNSDERQWQEHFYADNQQVARLPEAERAVIEAAKALRDAAHESPAWYAAFNRLDAAVDILRELEGET